MGQSKRRHIGQLPVSHGKFINSHSKSSRFAHRFGLLPLHNHIHAIRKNKRTKYSKSGSNFTSYSSKITCVFNQNSVPPEAKSRLHLFATAQVDYYNSSNSKLYTNTLSAPASNPMPASRTGGKFSKSPIPSYSLAGATGYAEGLIPPRSVSVKLTYTF